MKNIRFLSFEQFKNLVDEMYQMDTEKLEDFTVLRSCFDFIDLRKDNKIDLNEWISAMSNSEVVF